jgi:superoxide dismutase, Cu-Zn family
VIARSALAATVAAGTCLVAFSFVTAGPASASTSHREVHMSGNLSAAGSGSTFVSYDPEAAPTGTRVSVVLADTGKGHTQVALDVDGLLPDQTYTALAHVDPCGETAADAGGHFQGAAGTEVSLDLATDGAGAGHGEADVPFTFGSGGPRSVVLHQSGAAGQSGDDGAVACITLPGHVDAVVPGLPR